MRRNVTLKFLREHHPAQGLVEWFCTWYGYRGRPGVMTFVHDAYREDKPIWAAWLMVRVLNDPLFDLWEEQVWELRGKPDSERKRLDKEFLRRAIGEEE